MSQQKTDWFPFIDIESAFLFAKEEEVAEEELLVEIPQEEMGLKPKKRKKKNHLRSRHLLVWYPVFHHFGHSVNVRKCDGNNTLINTQPEVDCLEEMIQIPMTAHHKEEGWKWM